MNPSPAVRALCAISFAAAAAVSQQAPIDLSAWTVESYQGSTSAANWAVASGGSSVTQTVNGQPTMFVGDFPTYNLVLEGDLTTGTSDDDFLGFALGFEPGDMLDPQADYLLIDWKGGDQSFNFASCGPGGLAAAGLAVSRVSGVPVDDEWWQHVDQDVTCSPLGQGLTELQRGLTRGATPWTPGTTYHFRFVFEPTRLQVFIDGTLEIDVTGAFSDGRFAFYNFSQAGATYSALTQALAATATPYGGPCSVGSPLSLTSNPPGLGSTWTLQGQGVEPVSPMATFWFGDTQFSAGVDLSFRGGNGCFAYTNGNLDIRPSPVSGGAAATSLVVPNSLAINGMQIFVQMSALSTANPLGVTTSNAISARVGL